MSKQYEDIYEDEKYSVYKSNIGQCKVMIQEKGKEHNTIMFDNLEEFKNFIKGVNDAISQS